MHTIQRSDIASRVEQVFDRHGFAATGIDRLAAEAGVSTRTLYKHLGSKAGAMTAALELRMERFFARFDVESVDALFSALEEWTSVHGARGCLFLRAQGETGGLTAEVEAVVTAYRHRLRTLTGRVVAHDLGHEDAALADQILIVFEGATSAASYLGPRAIAAARAAACALVRREHAHHVESHLSS